MSGILNTLLKDGGKALAGRFATKTPVSGAVLLCFEPTQDQLPGYLETVVDFDPVLIQRVNFALSTIKQHPTAQVVKPLTLICEFYLTFVYNSSHASSLVRFEISLQTIIVFCCVSCTCTNLFQQFHCINKVSSSTCNFCKVEQHLGIAKLYIRLG